MSLLRALALVIVFAVVAPGLPSAATDPTPANQADREAQMKAAWGAAGKVAKRGPAEIKLLDEANLKLTDDEVFVPAAETNKIMELMGNGNSPSRFGLIASRRQDAEWFIIVSWIKEGYVRDGDAKEWQADALLDNLRKDTETGNIERVARGIPALDVVGWVEPPTYDGATHRLVWSLSLHDHGATATLPQTINYNTYALGRDGYVSLNLVTPSDRIAVDKAVVRDALDTLVFLPGKRYGDFDQSTDKVAEYGLAALVGAVAVKKLGLLALAGVWLFKVWKLGAIAIVGAAAAVRRFFSRRDRPSPP